MIAQKYNIKFDFIGDHGRLNVSLSAEVDVRHSNLYYVIRNFNLPGRQGSSLLPDMRLKKEQGQWVHPESGKCPDLSVSVGAAIDAHELKHI